MNRIQLEKVKLNLINHNKSRKGKTYENIFGEELGKLLRLKRSQELKGNKRCIGRIPWNKGIKGYPTSYRNHIISEETRRKMSDAQKKRNMAGSNNPMFGRIRKGEKHNIDCRGEKNSMWRGGHSDYRGIDWKKQSGKALKRDNGICRKCNKSTKVVHHIIPYRYSKDNSLKNLISLCNSCHMKEENKYRKLGITNYVRQMILENILKEGAITEWVK